MQIELQPADLEQVVGSVFSTMMGIEAAPRAHTLLESIPSGAMTAAVGFGGAWNGVVLIHCLPRQACEFAAFFLGMPPPETVDSDVRDVWGEVANMIAGNLKCALRPGIHISVPTVIENSGSYVDLPAYRSGFETPKGPFWLTVMQGSSPVQSMHSGATCR
jgi:CheY-specific phosphatase CheX